MNLLDPPSPPRTPWLRQSHKTLALWVVLILMFVAVYNMFSSPSPHHPPRSSDDVETGWGYIAAILVPIALWIGAIRWRTARFNRENLAAIDRLNKGAVARAAADFESLLARYRWPRNLRGVARYNAGHALLRQGELRRAIDLLIQTTKDRHVQNLKPQALLELAAAYALAGDVESAGKQLKLAEAIPNMSRPALVWPRALVAARRGELADLARALESSWRELEGQLTGESLRRLTILRAFAVATVEGPRGASAAEPLLQRVRPAAPGEFDWMVGAWPELGAFLRTHQL